MDLQNNKNVYGIAYAFRSAIQKAVREGAIREMQSFPRGCCRYASDLLQRYLFEQGIPTWSVSGRYGYGRKAESHAWLENEEGIVIDITGDQYKFKKLKFSEPVYVGVRSDGFHDKFILDEPLAYSINDDPFGQNETFDRRYESVLQHMNNV